MTPPFFEGAIVTSCLNSILESTGRYWRVKCGYPEDYYGPFR